MGTDETATCHGWEGSAIWKLKYARSSTPLPLGVMDAEAPPATEETVETAAFDSAPEGRAVMPK